MLTEDELCIIEEVNQEKPKYILDLTESSFPSLDMIDEKPKIEKQESDGFEDL